jgi:hypothetical protein
MRKILSLILLSVSLLFVRAIAAQDVAKADTAATGALSGRWIVNADFFGSPIYFGLLLEQHGENLTGNFDGDKLEGSAADGRIHFLAKDEHGGTEAAQRKLIDDLLALFECGAGQSSAEQNSMMRVRADFTGVAKVAALASSRSRITRSRSPSPGRPASDKRNV